MAIYYNLGIVIASLFWMQISAIPQPDLKAENPFTFDDIFDQNLRPKGFGPRWISDKNAFYYRSSDTGNVMMYDAETQNETVLVSNDKFNETGASTYYISSDLTHVLFAYETESLWRHSFNAKYKILNIASGDIIDFPTENLAADKKLNYAQWAPSSNALSFVLENDLYYQASPTAAPRRITFDGHLTDIFNGVPDWLYEEDVLGERVTHYWSPDNAYICYARINSSEVDMISWPLYGDKSDVYGKTRQIRYPKAGDVRDGKPGPNSVAELFVIDVMNTASTPVKIPPPPPLQSQQHYYVQVAWGNDTTLFVTWTNRVQNYSHSASYDVESDTPVPISGLMYEVVGGWVEVPPIEPIFIGKDADRYITIHPKDRGAEGSWRQLAVYSHTNDSWEYLSEDINEEVDVIYGYDSTRGFVYYSSTNGDPTERHIKRAALPGRDAPPPTCLTCDSPASCRYITSSFSDSAEYYFHNCRGPEIPTYALRSTVAGQENLNVVMEDNAEVDALLKQKALPTREFIDIPIGGGYSGRAEVFYPPGFVATNKYPILVYAYAGPGSQRVMKTFPMGSNTANWLTHLKSFYNVIIVSVDSRGASGRGDKFKFEMYRNLGTVEVQDQIAAASHFGEMAYVDKDKAKAVFGWSYGGGTTAHVIGDPTKVITCGISVAPVTTKMYYDTAYTERYLGLATPDDNEEGYNRTDVMNKANNFRGKHFMLNHGIADDNVHYMHTTQLIQALANADILFKQNAYIDQNHGISSPRPARHLYHTMTDFLVNECWAGSTDTIVSGTISHMLRHNSYLTAFFSLITLIVHVFLRV